MKKTSYFLLIGLVLLTLSFTHPPGTLVGRWRTKFPGGIPALLVCRTDGTHDFFINDKHFSSGRYYVRQDTVGFADPICNANYYGTYTFSFFARDSLRLSALSDTCRPRRGDLDRLTLGRVLVAKP